MPHSLFIFSSVLAVFGAALWQLLLKDGLFVTLGVWRVVQTIDEFPYACRKVAKERLSGCEDLWLDDDARVAGKSNVSARRPSGTEFLALTIDSPDDDGSFNLRAIEPVGYVGATGQGDASLDMLGFDGEVINEKTIHFYFVNQRPPVDAQFKHIDASKTGANATIEVFEYKKGANSMHHLRTVWAPDVLYTPNNVAAVGEGAFVATNDHSKGLGWRKALDFYIGGGGVVYCNHQGACEAMTPPRTFKMPNGLARGADNLIYVPSSVSGTISVYALVPGSDYGTFTLFDKIHVGMPLDNLALDANGDLWIPGFPDGVQLLKWMEKPLERKSPATVWRIKKVGENTYGKDQGAYEVVKMLEDGKAEVMNGITTVRHDVKTGRLFLGGNLFDSVGLKMC
ncbi:hypothetical protein N0V90_011301 [Kalmusia sp. IMI 367209]|nr:hypothetical protein N0V90_011301 [Kalmusia sp. IMI 367209]